jgi:hypothetical protein
MSAFQNKFATDLADETDRKKEQKSAMIREIRGAASLLI